MKILKSYTKDTLKCFLCCILSQLTKAHIINHITSQCVPGELDLQYYFTKTLTWKIIGWLLQTFVDVCWKRCCLSGETRKLVCYFLFFFGGAGGWHFYPHTWRRFLIPRPELMADRDVILEAVQQNWQAGRWHDQLRYPKLSKNTQKFEFIMHVRCISGKILYGLIWIDMIWIYNDILDSIDLSLVG